MRNKNSFLLLSIFGLNLLAICLWPANAAESQDQNRLDTVQTANEGKFSMGNVRSKRNFGHTIKAFGITVLALAGASLVLGVDYAVTTIFTPLMIITLTKNIDVKAIIDTCNYRRRQHMAGQGGNQNLLKALFCVPTEDEAHIHKSRFFLDVLKVAFKYSNAKTLELIKAEHSKFVQATAYMDKSADWNAPKRMRSVLLFFEIYGIIDYAANQVPDFIDKAQLESELEAATNEALAKLVKIAPGFVKEEVEMAIKAARKQNMDVSSVLDKIMREAEQKVKEDYQQKSLRYKIDQKVKVAAKFLRKLAGRDVPDTKEGKAKADKELDEDRKYAEERQNLINSKDNKLSILMKIDKYGLLNYDIVGQDFLEQLQRDLSFADSPLVRIRYNDAKLAEQKEVEQIQKNLNKQSEVNIKTGTVESTADEMELENADLEKEGEIYLDPAEMDNYPRLFRKLIRKVFDEELQKLENPMTIKKGFVNDEVISQQQLYIELTDMPKHVQRLYIQYELFRAVFHLLNELFSREDERVQKYYVKFLYIRKEVKGLLDHFHQQTTKHLALELRKEVFAQMQANGAFGRDDVLLEFLRKHKLGKSMKEWWVQLQPFEAMEKMMEFCKSIQKCAADVAAEWFNLYEHFLWLSNQYRMKTDLLKNTEAKNVPSRNKNERANGQPKGHEHDKSKDAVPLKNFWDPESYHVPRLMRILDEMIAEQKVNFQMTVDQNVQPSVTKGQIHIEKNLFEPTPNVVEVHSRKKRFILSSVLINILRTSSWMQLFKHFNVVDIVRDCVVRSINFQQWTCQYPAAIKAEQNFIHKFKRILFEELSCKALPELRQLYDNFVRKHMAGQKRPSPSELLAEAEMVIPYRWEQMLDDYSWEVWMHYESHFREKCQ